MVISQWRKDSQWPDTLLDPHTAQAAGQTGAGQAASAPSSLPLTPPWGVPSHWVPPHREVCPRPTRGTPWAHRSP